MKRLTALILTILCLSGCVNMHSVPFENEYTIPDTTTPYTRIDTKPKTDWTAHYIWDSSDGSEENVWMCMRKSFDLDIVPKELNAFISADSKYWLYINGKLAVFEGGVKRGPTPDGSYFDTVPVASYLKPGRNVICALVWYWGNDTSYSSTDSGKAGFLFEAGDILSNQSWKVCRNEAYGNDHGKNPNYRLPESNIYYDARKEPGDWLSPDFDDSSWENATENGHGGCSPWGKLFPRGIPMLKDFGLKDFEQSAEFKNNKFSFGKKITLDIPYNAQCTPYIKVDAPSGKKIRIRTEKKFVKTVRDTYITKDGVQEFEALGWFNGEHITFDIPAGVTILELKYRETGYDTEFSGSFECENIELNSLWQKSLRTLYVTMRDNFMDCPDRERAQWWGDVTSEMMMSMYSLDPSAYLLYQKGVASMLGHIDPETKVLQTVVPISEDYFELPVQQLAGICGFWTYYLYTGDVEFLKTVFDATIDYVNLWEIGEDKLVKHREGSWDWMDWGRHADVTAIENAWYYYALTCIRNMAEVIGESSEEITAKMETIKSGYASLWTDKGYKSGGVSKPDDRANALAVLSGIAEPDKYDTITNVLSNTKNSSPYMEYYVLEALCKMSKFDVAKERMLKRYSKMIRKDYSTLWELWIKIGGTLNHAWSGGPLVIMSKHFAGIRPTKAGWDEFIIKPLPDISSALKCTVPTVKGFIRLKEQKNDDSLIMDVSVPKGTIAVVCIPCSHAQTVTCNNTVIYKDEQFIETDDLTFVKAENGYIAVSVKSETNRDLHFEAHN